MRTILTISKRELTRLRSRFRGRARFVFFLILLGAAALSFVTYQRAPTPSAGIYRLGLSPDAPRVDDARFAITRVDPTTGRALLDAQALDIYIDGTQVLSRTDEKSRYAANVLKRALEKSELVRIGNEFNNAEAFPLRVEINYFAPGGPATGQAASGQAATGSPTPGAGATPANDRSHVAQAPDFRTDPDKQTIIPSLTTPPNPFSQAILALIFIMPVFLVSVFFTSGFMDEKTNRRLVILLSAPLTPFQIIAGKMLPYVLFSLAGIVAISWFTQASPLLALTIFAPAVLFIFGIYLMVPMLYRTFKDTTFISMLVTAMTTAYLVFPAMFSGISELAYMSPITLAVKMYRAESFGIKEYLFATVPLGLIFGLSLYVSTRVLNEEYLMGYRPLYRKHADAIYLVLNRAHLNLSILALSLILIPIVYIVQLVVLAISLNLPMRLAVGSTLLASAAFEEVVKSAGIAVLNEHGHLRSTRQVIWLSFLSALGFLVGEKGLVYVSLGIVSQNSFSQALFSSGALPIPLAAHFIFTSIVCVLHVRFRLPYPIAIAIATLVHALYNYAVLGGLQ